MVIHAVFYRLRIIHSHKRKIIILFEFYLCNKFDLLKHLFLFLFKFVDKLYDDQPSSTLSSPK